MGWNVGEMWLDTDVLWFRELAAATSAPARPIAALAGFAPVEAWAEPLSSGLAASRERRAARRKRQNTTRVVSAAALFIGSTAMLPLNGERSAVDALRALLEDPPSQTFRLGSSGLALGAGPETGGSALYGIGAASSVAAASPLSTAKRAPLIRWHDATSRGRPFAGSLSNGTQFPIAGPDWVTWNPVTDSVPNQSHRLYGHERTIRTLLAVITAFRAEHPDAPKVVVGDLSLRGGGSMNEHVSHQNGLDADVYYPRLDRALRAANTRVQVDGALAQALLDRFVAAGAKVIFVGYSTGLHGPRDVVVPYPNHESHMHVRFPAPG
jgi:Penicillin-insensitive murein endopeptidase